MYVTVGTKMINADDVKSAETFYRLVEITYNSGWSEGIRCASEEEAKKAVAELATAKNRGYISPSPTIGGTTADKINTVDRQMEALAARKRQLEQQKAVEDGCEALGTLIAAGVCAIAGGISRCREKKRK